MVGRDRGAAAFLRDCRRGYQAKRLICFATALLLVYVDRTLGRTRVERIVLVDRQIAIILDLDRLREFAEGLPQVAQIPIQ
jgi:hypothetical protein